MKAGELRRILDQVTREILDRLHRTGFRLDLDDEASPVRYDPVVWDIGNGACEEWADRVAELIPGAFSLWVDQDHCVLVYDGRFYDADCPEGTEHFSQLPMFAEPSHERPEP